MNSLRAKINTRHIVLISVLVTLGVIFSIFDRFISSAAFPFLPTAKIGLANIVILIGIYRFKFKEALLMTILKSTLVGLILGSPTTFVIGFTASMLSFFGMYATYRLLNRVATMISVSVVGGFLHIWGQLLAVAVIYQLGTAVLTYGALLVFVSLVTSIIIGFVGLRMLQIFDQKENS